MVSKPQVRHLNTVDCCPEDPFGAVCPQARISKRTARIIPTNYKKKPSLISKWVAHTHVLPSRRQKDPSRAGRNLPTASTTNTTRALDCLRGIKLRTTGLLPRARRRRRLATDGTALKATGRSRRRSRCKNVLVRPGCAWLMLALRRVDRKGLSFEELGALCRRWTTINWTTEM